MGVFKTNRGDNMNRLIDGTFVHSRYQAKQREADQLLHPSPIEVSVYDSLNCGKLRRLKGL